MTYRHKRTRRHKKYRRKQIGRGKKKKLAKALVKHVGLPLIHRKIGSRKFKVPILPYRFQVKKQGNSYGLRGSLPLFGGLIEPGKQVL